MGFARTAGLGMIASAATMASRRTAWRAMHRRSGDRRLPQAAKRTNWVTVVLLAVAAGAMLGLADVLKEQGQQARRV